MDLHLEGQELARFRVEGLPENPGQVSIRLTLPTGEQTQWMAVTPDEQNIVRVLVRGPLSSEDAQAVLLPAGTTLAEGLLIDNPEKPIRVAGAIRVGV